ncbi:hypothetical protein ABB37_05421 [Leptomonas pyrrhocoris]|uniref:Uncharacterized protein n=1 Tax=Leptomonas pyrrhocoris TaxID=157538 RepID=A0A0M9G0D5_LEPPY|nr:hypothetical protein ABB37_05421 [Leptomonas pyrrhocoris]KPA79629.1 hypothetical protein ABB37_05421 [Leptomonas pyrrhocoris]|eukprot:XP_015658068.1 hypothetical protein ABB37_05421 [Leptomonas pyrrhocoris]
MTWKRSCNAEISSNLIQALQGILVETSGVSQEEIHKALTSEQNPYMKKLEDKFYRLCTALTYRRRLPTSAARREICTSQLSDNYVT